MKSTSARGRGAAAFVASMALVGSAATITTGPARSAEPTGDCAAPYPVADLADGQAVHGLTVSDGTTPEGFSGEVLGVLNDGIAPNLDMVMVKLTDAATTGEIDAKGIWAGMSGSPVYAEDGRLIGAVAYGLAWGDSPVAGVTPYADMSEYMTGGTAPRTIAVSDRAARAIAEDTSVTARQAGQGFRQLPMPLSYSGISPKRLAQVKQDGPKYFHAKGVRSARAGGATSAGAAAPTDLVAGGNLAAAISYGTVTFGGVGTVTSVCDGRLVGFGHPMTFGGKTTLGMMPADALYIQDDLITAFKVANFGEPAGTIDQDRLTGISGNIGPLPEQTDISSTVSYGARTRDGVSHTMVPDYNADVTFTQLLSLHDTAIDAIQPGSEAASYTLTGTDADDQPFEIQFNDRYVSRWDIAFEGIWDIADAVYVLSRMRGVTVDDVTTTSEVTDSTATLRLDELQARQHGKWVTVNRRTRVVTKAGRALRVRAVLVRGDDARTVPFRLAVPKKARRSGYLVVEGGASVWSRAVYRAKTPAELEEALENGVRNDQVRASLVIPRRGPNLQVSDVSEPQDLVVRGGEFAEVRIRR